MYNLPPGIPKFYFDVEFYMFLIHDFIINMLSHYFALMSLLRRYIFLMTYLICFTQGFINLSKKNYHAFKTKYFPDIV